MGIDPVVHGVAADELDVGHFFADAALEDGIDIGEEEKLGVAIGLGNFGLEGGEDIEVGDVGFGFIQVVEEVGDLPRRSFSCRGRARCPGYRCCVF